MAKLKEKARRNLKRKKAKSNLLLEIAEDIMDVIHNAKVYRKINKNKKRNRRK